MNDILNTLYTQLRTDEVALLPPVSTELDVIGDLASKLDYEKLKTATESSLAYYTIHLKRILALEPTMEQTIIDAVKTLLNSVLLDSNLIIVFQPTDTIEGLSIEIEVANGYDILFETALLIEGANSKVSTLTPINGVTDDTMLRINGILELPNNKFAEFYYYWHKQHNCVVIYTGEIENPENLVYAGSLSDI